MPIVSYCLGRWPSVSVILLMRAAHAYEWDSRADLFVSLVSYHPPNGSSNIILLHSFRYDKTGTALINGKIWIEEESCLNGSLCVRVFLMCVSAIEMEQHWLLLLFILSLELNINRFYSSHSKALRKVNVMEARLIKIVIYCLSFVLLTECEYIIMQQPNAGTRNQQLSAPAAPSIESKWRARTKKRQKKNKLKQRNRMKNKRRNAG